MSRDILEKTVRETDTNASRKPVVAFVCTHNSCRSQIAEALGKRLAGDVFESCSAGTELKDRIDRGAHRLVLERYGVDMDAKGQRSKLVDEIPRPDIVVRMGCAVQCPIVPAMKTEDWGLPDPTGEPDETYFEVMDAIEANILRLKQELSGGISN